MGTNGISSYDLTVNLMALNSAQSKVSTTLSGKAQGSDTDGDDATDSAKVSQPAEMLSKLQQLKTSDPEKFKQVVSDIASKLKSASQQKSGFGSKMLSDLAEKFQNVADGGDLSQLEPPKPPNPPQGTQGMASQYLKQDKLSTVDHLKRRGDHEEMRSLMDSIFDKVDKAFSESQASAA